MESLTLAVLTLVLAAPPETEVTVELKNCTQVQAEALFGAKGSGCLIYDVKKKEAKTEIELCGGLMVGVALKIGGGAAFQHEKIVCVKMTTVLNPSDAKTAKEFLGSDKSDSKAVRELLKNKLIEELKKQGLDNNSLKKIKSIQFEEFKDATNRSKELRKTIDQCTPAKEFKKIS